MFNDSGPCAAVRAGFECWLESGAAQYGIMSTHCWTPGASHKAGRLSAAAPAWPARRLHGSTGRSSNAKPVLSCSLGMV